MYTLSYRRLATPIRENLVPAVHFLLIGRLSLGVFGRFCTLSYQTG